MQNPPPIFITYIEVEAIKAGRALTEDEKARLTDANIINILDLWAAEGSHRLDSMIDLGFDLSFTILPFQCKMGTFSLSFPLFCRILRQLVAF